MSCLVLVTFLALPCIPAPQDHHLKCDGASLLSKLYVLDADNWPTYHMPQVHMVSEDRRGYYTVNSYDDMPLSRSPSSCKL